jgi:hypothetical protein
VGGRPPGFTLLSLPDGAPKGRWVAFAVAYLKGFFNGFNPLIQSKTNYLKVGFTYSNYLI